ncbi:sporulation protein [Kitasatospora sp. NPDC052896]|uniref:sporulation protein n=1 Tax=Kitasatospora sp. NPDC052896 TaxID=3364061 RepID=UPI0037C76447
MAHKSWGDFTLQGFGPTLGDQVFGTTPRPPVPALLAQALAERLGRPVSLAEIGMGSLRDPTPSMGLDFARTPTDAVRVATHFWSHVDRRDFLGSSFAISAYATPVTRWLVRPTDDNVAQRDGRRVGRRDLDELWDAADEARRWDSKYGGGNWKANSVTDCLKHRAAPLLNGSFTDPIGKELFSVTAELSRVTGWSAFDVGQHDAAQRHFIQALRLARAGGNVELGGYVLTTMALQALLRGYSSEAIDMAQGAFERSKGIAAPRVLAFSKLIEARAHGRARDPRAAAAALSSAEALLGQARPDREPAWIGYFDHARLSADATEIYRDLHNPKAALTWNAQAATMSPGAFTRSVGLRMTVVAMTHLQARDLEQGLVLGHQAIDILARVQSTRALGYVRDLTAALTPWKDEVRVSEFVHRARTELTMAI